MPAWGGELLLTPSITVSEEYNDNVYLTNTGKRDDFITRISPGLNLEYASPFWDWQVRSRLDFEWFANGTRSVRYLPTVNATGRMRLIDNFLFLDVNDFYSQVPETLRFEGAHVNQVNQNYLSVSPYVRFRPALRNEVTTGYVYKNMLYEQADAVGWQEHDLFVKVNHELTDRSSCFLNVTYAFTTTDNSYEYSRVTPSIGCKYFVDKESWMLGEIGYSFLSLDNGSSVSSPFWNVRAQQRYGTLVATLDGGVSYNADMYSNVSEKYYISGGLTKEFPRGSIGIKPFYDTTKDYVSDSTINSRYGVSVPITYAMTDKLVTHLNLYWARVKESQNYYNLYSNTPTNESYVYYSHMFADVGFTYELAEGLNVFSSYILSYDDYSRNYGNSSGVYNNRFILGLTKTFQTFRL